MVWEIGEHYPKPETVMAQERQRLQQERDKGQPGTFLPHAGQEEQDRPVMQRFQTVLFGGSSDEEKKTRKSKNDYEKLRRMEAHEQALSKMEELRLMRQTELKNISGKYSRNEQRSEELRGELSFAKYQGDRFMRDKIEDDLGGLRTEQMVLHFDYMNILSAMINEALSGMHG